MKFIKAIFFIPVAILKATLKVFFGVFIRLPIFCVRKILGFIYPGQMTAKRIRHGIVLLLIGLNLAVSALYRYMFEISGDMLEKSEELATYGTNIADKAERVLPYAQRLQVLMEDFNINSKWTNPISDARQKARDDIHMMRSYAVFIADYSQTFRSLALILKLFSWLAWIPILGSLLWLFSDLRKGNKKLIPAFILIVLIPWNYYVYDYLTDDMGKTIRMTKTAIEYTGDRIHEAQIIAADMHNTHIAPIIDQYR